MVKKAWKKEAGFDRIEIIAEMHAQCFHAGFGSSEPLYTRLFYSRWPYTPDEHELDMDFEMEWLRLEILLLQPAPSPQYDLSPRRSPAVGTGLDELEVQYAEMQSTKQEGTSPLQVTASGFLHVSCTSPEQETTFSIQTDVGVNEEEATTTVQATARQDFVRLSIGRQQRGTTSTE